MSVNPIGNGPLSGVRVIDLGIWVSAPAVSALLADWGADVVKVESPTGDPLRGFFSHTLGTDRFGGETSNPPFELDNRGKRSLALDLRTTCGREVFETLLGQSDVLVTNLRVGALGEMDLLHESVLRRHPRLIFCHVSGFGLGGTEENRASYDVGAFYARSGMASMMTVPGGYPPPPGSAMGDHVTGMAGAAAVSAALFCRATTGRGQMVSVSLTRVGAYTMGWDLNTALRGGRVVPRSREAPTNPLLNSYSDRDGRWFWLLLLQPDRHWPALCRALGRPDLMADPRYGDMDGRRRNGAELVHVLSEAFAAKPLNEWASAFDAEDVWWSPVLDIAETIQDPATNESGAFVSAGDGDGSFRTVAGPVDFSVSRWSIDSSAPQLGQHTEEILLELGYSWDQIGALADNGAIP